MGGWPESMDPGDSGSAPDIMCCWAVWERLTDRNPKTMELYGQLAEKWEQTSPTSWRFTLRKGIKFHNGETFDAESVAFVFNRHVQRNDKILTKIPTVKEAKVVDPNTVDIITTGPDPILPVRLYWNPMFPKKWTQENPELVPIQAMGTGPYRVVEWNKGQYIRVTANENYWGPPPNIKDVTLVVRGEPSVRAAMLQTGEADFAFMISPEDVKRVPKVETGPGIETAVVRLNAYNPALADKRVRQAINYAIDRKSLADKLLGGFATPASHPFAPFIIGYNKTLQPYPYDPDKAKKLVSEAKAAGVPVETPMQYLSRRARFIKEAEFSEAAVNFLNAVGFKFQLKILEDGMWREAFYQTADLKNLCDLCALSHSNEQGDASKSVDGYVTPDGRLTTMKDEKATKMAMDARPLTGDARQKAYSELMAYLYDEALPFLNIVYLDQIYGLSKRLDWKVRMDTVIDLREMKIIE